MRPWIKTNTFALAVLIFHGALFAQSPLPVAIKPDNPAIYYVGRFDTHDPAGPRCGWSASTVTIRFRGTDLQAAIKDNGPNYFEIIIDGKKNQTVSPGKGESVIDLAKHLPAGEHVVDFCKRTEASQGSVQFTGFYLNAGGELLPPHKLTRKLEVIGDSISCGYGNEGKDTTEKAYNFENSWLSYGAIAARTLGAEYHCAAWSGRKLTNTGPIYGLTIPTDASSAWDFTSWQPDAVLINLATNDFGSKNPDEDQWTGEYKAFLRRVRKYYPNAMIYIATGSMMNDSWHPENKSLTTVKKYLQRIEDEMRAEGETKLHQIHFDVQRIKLDGVGGGTHPNRVTHQKMADKWIAALEKDLGWQPVTAVAE